MDVIATGFPERTDPAALVVGPTGVGLDEEGTLFVADTQGNRIAEVPGAMHRQTPVGAEFQPLDTGAGAGGLFGIAVAPQAQGVLFVNDANNTLGLLH